MEATISTNEAALVGRCRTGDEGAWGLLVERFSRYVYAICVHGYRLSPVDAEDVFQVVFAKVFQQLPQLRNDSAVRPWIAQLTRRACIDRLRELRRESPVEVQEPAGVEDRVALLDEALAVREALLRLPETCREILDRFFGRDESYRTIGEALDLPPGTIASRISRCLEKLRAEMEDVAPAARQVGG